MITKRCGKCGETKTLSDFYTRSDGRPQSACKVCCRAYARETYDSEAKSAYNKAYFQKNKQTIYLRQRSNHLGYNADRRARLKEAFVQKIDRRVVWGRDEGHCRVKLVCEGVFVPFEEMHLDHIIPLVAGGKHAHFNVQTACASCNLAKGAKCLTSL